MDLLDQARLQKLAITLVFVGSKISVCMQNPGKNETIFCGEVSLNFKGPWDTPHPMAHTVSTSH